MNYAALIQLQAERVFGNKAKAYSWLNQPKAAFGGATPMKFSDSEAGYLSVKDELERISQGYAL
ncbi:MbcA/ParS/Xre antitoxin family protein [Pseudomonas fluorescens]|uniref:MbcA/ParS/Xre antitoxin family protein n=1 Tax=Pseudomonas fluorescens TaxID=294 RepID=UPI0012425F84|nr:MbcA/ParS/Xre antitoxin family protein [Pseudomonas fluorescens]